METPGSESWFLCLHCDTVYQLCAQDVENGIRMSCFRFTHRRSCPKVEQMRLSVEQNTCCCRTSNRRVTVVTLPQPQTPDINSTPTTLTNSSCKPPSSSHWDRASWTRIYLSFVSEPPGGCLGAPRALLSSSRRTRGLLWRRL